MYNTHCLHRMRPFFKFPSLSPPCFPWFRKRSKPGMNAAKCEKRCQCFGCHLRISPESTCKKNGKDYEWGNRVVVRMRMTVLVMTPWKFWWCWWWSWQRWWGRSWQIPVMLIKSQSDDIGLYGFKIIILQVWVITREISCSFLKSFRVGYWNMFGAGSRGCDVRKCNCVASNMCASAIA